MDYLSKENVRCIKGLFAVCVLVHHLYQYSGLFRNALGAAFQAIGYLAVSMFFFFTGYGLAFSFRTKENYGRQFLKTRFCSLYLFYVNLVILYSMWAWCLNQDISVGKIVQSFFIGKTIVCFGWYFQVTFLIYLLTWLAYKQVKNRIGVAFVIFLELMIYCVICEYTGLPSFWYESVFCVILGMLWDEFKPGIDKLLKRHAIKLIFISGMLFILCRFFMHVSFLENISKILSSLTFVICFIGFTYILSGTPVVCNRATNLIGNYSLEIYASQGFLFMLKMSEKISCFNNPYIFILITTIGTAILAYLLKSINNAVYRK